MRAFVPPFDQRQRYEVVSELAASLPTGIRVLDVGGFYRDLDGTVVLPIQTAVPHGRTLTVDVERVIGAELARPVYAVADGTRLPFPNTSFDLVSCLDVLEHVPRDRRAALIAELFRVSRGYVVLAMPIADEGAVKRERALQRYISLHLAGEQQQLREHAQFGLPTDEEVRAMLPATAASFGYGNLDRWAVMMFAKHFLLGVPHNLDAFYALDTEYAKLPREGDLVAPFYRRAYITAVPGARQDLVQHVAARYEPVAAASPVVDAVLDLVFDVLVKYDPERLKTEREVSEHRAAHLEQALGEAHTHVENLEERGRHLEGALEQAWAHVGNLERVRALLEKDLQDSTAHIANLADAAGKSAAHIANLEEAAEKSSAHIANLEEAAEKSSAHIANLEQVKQNLTDSLDGAQVHIRNLEAGHRAQVAGLEQTIGELREVLRQVEASKVYRLYRFTQRLAGRPA